MKQRIFPVPSALQSFQFERDKAKQQEQEYNVGNEGCGKCNKQ